MAKYVDGSKRFIDPDIPKLHSKLCHVNLQVVYDVVGPI